MVMVLLAQVLDCRHEPLWPTERLSFFCKVAQLAKKNSARTAASGADKLATFLPSLPLLPSLPPLPPFLLPSESQEQKQFVSSVLQRPRQEDCWVSGYLGCLERPCPKKRKKGEKRKEKGGRKKGRGRGKEGQALRELVRWLGPCHLPPRRTCVSHSGDRGGRRCWTEA